jgi:glutaredoxin-related protein
VPQLGEHDEALAHYDRALLLSQQESNIEAQGMVLLGKGFALMNIGRAPEAAEALAACKELSSGNPAQERFVADLLMQAQAAALHQQELQGDNSAPAPAVRPIDADAGAEDAKGRAQGGDGAGAAAGMQPQPDKRTVVSVQEVPNTPAMGGAFEHAVRAAFVKSVVLKECVVLVMEGSPSAAATPQQHAIAQALQQIRLRLHYIDTTNDAELAQEFVHVWAAPAQDVEHGSEESSAGSGSERQAQASGSEPTPDDRREEGKHGIQPLGGETLPLLFVGGKLFGGSVRIGGLRREGTENLKQAILDALPAHMNAQDRALLFAAPEVEMREWEPPAKHACGGHGVEGEDGESREACKTEHTERLRRLVSFVAAKVAGGLHEAWDAAAARYPGDDEAVLAFLSAPTSSSSSSSPGPPSADAAQVARSFIAELATTLGGLDLPHGAGARVLAAASACACKRLRMCRRRCVHA